MSSLCKRSVLSLSAIATLSLAILAIFTEPANAWGSLDVKLGKGEEVQAKSGFFGNKKFKAQDRLGDKLEESRGILGNEHEAVQMLGNGFAYNRGIFGNKSLSGGTMLGDKFETHRMLFGIGPRITKVDLSGTTGLAEQFLGGGRINPAGLSGGLPGAVGGAAPIDYQKYSPLHRLHNGTVQPQGGFSSDGKPLPADAGAQSQFGGAPAQANPSGSSDLSGGLSGQFPDPPKNAPFTPENSPN
ncbi:MAG: hypothetical protein KGS72_10830 [Cyanobacteria bacterium REEB67]|nr:hypothetical protein [Cyanobacteria bacterium REEB67]